MSHADPTTKPDYATLRAAAYALCRESSAAGICDCWPHKAGPCEARVREAIFAVANGFKPPQTADNIEMDLAFKAAETFHRALGMSITREQFDMWEQGKTGWVAVVRALRQEP